MKKENETAPAIDPEIKFDKRNYRRHSERNEKMISESLANYGAGRSILIDSENELIAGNGVYSQAKKLGIPTRLVETDGSELIVVKRTDLKTDDLKRKYLAVADNAISDSSDFDLDLLKTDFDPMVLKTTFDIDLEVPNVDAPSSGYSDDDLERGGPDHEPYTIEPIKDVSSRLSGIFEVVCECENENEQKELFDRLTNEGIKCRILIL